jgi:hypothetical protein
VCAAVVDYARGQHLVLCFSSAHFLGVEGASGYVCMHGDFHVVVLGEDCTLLGGRPTLRHLQRIAELLESWRIMVEFNTSGGPGQQYQVPKVTCYNISHWYTQVRSIGEQRWFSRKKEATCSLDINFQSPKTTCRTKQHSCCC